MQKEYQIGVWDYPSDHLPVCATIVLEPIFGLLVDSNNKCEDNSFSVGSFNVLNERYKAYLRYGYGKIGDVDYKRGQQLAGSVLDTISEKDREEHLLRILRKGFENGLHIIGLQECSTNFNEALLRYFNETHGFIFASEEDDDDSQDFGAIIYDKILFEVISTQVDHYLQNDINSNYIQIAQLLHKPTNETIMFINTHTPFGESHQLVDFMLKNIPCQLYSTVLVGDLNMGYNDTRDESDLENNVLVKLRSQNKNIIEFKQVRDIAAYSHINTQPVFDLFDHIFTSNLIAKPNATLTQKMRLVK